MAVGAAGNVCNGVLQLRLIVSNVAINIHPGYQANESYQY